MRRRKIDIGNAADVIQRKRDVTIIPNDPQSLEFTSSDRNVSYSLRYSALDVVHGGPAPNPDAISVNLSTYPGWKVNEYDCALNPFNCPNHPGIEDSWVEITYELESDWVDAYLVIEMSHATNVGAAANEYLFKVDSAALKSDISMITPLNLTKAIAAPNDVVNPTGVYLWKIATTDSDGKRIMLMEMRDPGAYELMFDEAYIRSAGTSGGVKHSVKLAGVGRPEEHYNTLTPSVSITGSFFNYTLEAV